VYAELDRKATEITKSEYGEKVPLKDRSETYESTETDPALEPGVVSNVTPNAPVAAGGSKTEKNLTEVTYAGQVDATVTRSEVARFGLMSLRVAVSVPRSFLVALFKRGNEGKEPTDQELIEYLPVKETIDKIESLVEGVLPNPQQTQSTVVVQWFPDDAVMSFAEMMEAGSGAGMMDYVHNYGSKAGMAALALFSLIMMMLMVRRVGEGPVLPGEEPPDPSLFKKNKKRRGDDEDPEELFVAGGPVGEAEVSEHLLEGREVDETTLHIQKIVEQVADMVSDDPATSAGILQRWIDSDKQ
jgi:flagellar biosynthesis/type III secretory pathway M-ring protein FliF/YscJ